MNTRKIVSLSAKVRNCANDFIERELESNNVVGIVPAHGVVLNILFNEENGIPMKKLVENTGKAKSTITSNISTLFKYGFIEKKQDPTDARSQLITLTEKGEELEPLFHSISEKLLVKVYKNVPVNEQEQVVAIMEKILLNFK